MANVATTGTNFPKVNVGDALAVGGDTALAGALAVTGNTSFSGTISAGGAVILNATPFDRMVKVCVTNFTGPQLHAGVRSWANPESADIIVGPVVINLVGNTLTTGTLSVGVHTSATTLSCTIIDNTSCNTTAVLNSVDHGGTNGAFARKVATGSYVTFAEASGNAALAIVTANCSIYYTLI